MTVCKKLRAGDRVLAVGDSNVLGQLLNPGEAFPELVGAAMALDVVNLGIQGTHSAQWAAWGPLNAQIEAAKPADALVILLGTNDAIQGVHVSTYLGNIQSTIWKFGGPVFLIAPPPFPAFEFAVGLLAAWVRGLAETSAPVCGVVDTHDFLTVPADFLPDEVHLNAQGQQKVADALIAEMGG